MKQDRTQHRYAGHRRGSREGSALIVALWVIVILSLLVVSFAFDMELQARITSYYRKRLQAGGLARGGMERARMLLVKSADADIRKEDYEEQEAWWYVHAKDLSYGGPVSVTETNLASGTISLYIVPEPARRNVNRLNRDDWERVLEVADVPEDLWDELIDCFTDWKDTGDSPEENGAETDDYYATLDNPYRAKNGPLDTVDELLLIKGFTMPMLYGGLPEDADEDDVPMSGMKDLLTTFGNDRVNVNAAGPRVLRTLRDMDEDLAAEIVQEREGYMEERDPQENYLYTDINNFYERVPDASSALRGRISTASGTYRITCLGDAHGVTRRISCIAEVDGKGKMRIIRWIEDEGQ